jgi:hypothetical protein
MNEYRRERASFRFTYPPEYPERLIPRVVLEPGCLAILEDWSETGIRIAASHCPVLAVNEIVHLTVTPHASDVFSVEGMVARVDGASISIRLRPPALPSPFILSEQAAIRAWLATAPSIGEEIEAKLRNSGRTVDELS